MKNKILKKRGNWNFKGKVVPNFDNHINLSVPLYKEGHELIIKLSDFFLKNRSNCYDLGCSTGNLLFKLKNFTNKKVNFFGVDVEKDMTNFAKKKLKKQKIKNIKIENKNLIQTKLKKSDLIICYYTLQFINPEHRQNFLKKIYKALNWGGGFILYEKIRGPDARFQDMYTSLYNDFKEKNGLSIYEIFNKQKSLRGVLEPFSDFGNIGLLKRAGFKDITTISQYLCFKGYLCIK